MGIFFPFHWFFLEEFLEVSSSYKNNIRNKIVGGVLIFTRI